MSKGYLYVAPITQPKETFAEKFSTLGEKMSAAQRANQAGQMKQAQALAKQRNQQLSAFNATLKNTDSWSQRDVEVQVDLIKQSEDLLRQNPESYQDLLLELMTYHGLGDSQAKVRSGLSPEDERYIEYQQGERKAPVDGMAAVTSNDDYQLRSQSYDEMFEETGSFTSPSGLVYPSGNYYAPGTKTTLLNQFQNRVQTESDPLFGSEIQVQENPQNGTTTAVAIKDGAVVGEQIVSGPANLFPGRGSGGYFTPRFVSSSFVSAADTVKDFNTVISNLRGQVNGGDISESEARTILSSRVAENYNSPSGAGMRAASMEMWRETYPDREFNPEDFKVGEGAENSPAANHGIKTPLELYQDAVTGIADVSKDPVRSGSAGRQNDYSASRESWRNVDGLPGGLQQDLGADSPRRVLYGERADGFSSLPSNVQGAEITIPNENLEYVDPNDPSGSTRYYGKLFAYPEANIVMLQKKADDYQGKPSDVAVSDDTRNRHLNDNQTSTYWDKAPSSRYVNVAIFDDNGKFTSEFLKLSGNFQQRYRNEATVSTSDDASKNTLFQEIMRLSQ